MKIKIQVVENSDRFHVSQDGIPQQTLLIGNYISRQICRDIAKSLAFDLAVQKQSDDFEIELLPIEIL